MITLILLAVLGIDPLDEIALAERARSSAATSAGRYGDAMMIRAAVFRDIAHFASRRLDIPTVPNEVQLRRIADTAVDAVLAARPPVPPLAPDPNPPPGRLWYAVDKNGTPRWVWGWRDQKTGLIGMFEHEQPPSMQVPQTTQTPFLVRPP